MTTSYDPFAPADESELPRHGGRRRANDRWAQIPVQSGGSADSAGQRWSDEPAQPSWAPEAAGTAFSDEPAQAPWSDEPAPSSWAQEPRWAGDEWRTAAVDFPAAGYAPAGYGSSGYGSSGYGSSGYAESYAPTDYAQSPAPGGDRAPDRPGESYGPLPETMTPGYATTGPQPPAAGYPVPARKSPWTNRTWVRPVLVVALVAAAGWQAYRIEGVTRDNQTLVSGLGAERVRTDRLEQRLAGVFDPEAVASRVLPSVFRVRAGDFTGTAFSVGDKAPAGKANLVTNYHVVAQVWTDGGRTVTLERGTTRIEARIVKVNKGKDLAQLQAGQVVSPLETGSGQVKPGQQVVVVGAPLGLDDTVTSGVISAFRPNDPQGPTIQFDAAINPGNSGGPVVNSDEQVVGVATAKARDAEGIGLAIPIKTACDTFAVC